MKNSHLNKWSQNNWIFIGEKNLASSHFTLQIKIFLKWITDLTVNAKTIKFKAEEKSFTIFCQAEIYETEHKKEKQ